MTTNKHFNYIWKEKKPSKLKLAIQVALSFLFGYAALWLLMAVAALQR